jgi:hypothetical protein
VKVNAQYNIAKANSLPVKVAEHQRRKMFVAFLNAMTSAVSLVAMPTNLLLISNKQPRAS